MLQPKEQEDIKGTLSSEQHTPSANTVYPLSTILAVVGAGKFYFKFHVSTKALTTANSLPGSLHFGRGWVHW